MRREGVEGRGHEEEVVEVGPRLAKGARQNVQPVLSHIVIRAMLQD